MALGGLLAGIQIAGSSLLESPWLHNFVHYVQYRPWISLGLTLVVFVAWKIVMGPRNLPPGPFNYPLIGAPAFLRQDMEVKMMEMRPIYGDVIYLKLLGNAMVILNSERVIREALLRRSEDFAHRQISVFMKAIEFTKDEIFMAQYDEEWKINKKFAVTTLKTFGFGTPRSEAKIQSGIDKLEAAFADTAGQPNSTFQTLKEFTTATFFSIFYNEDLGLKDPWLTKILALSTEFITGFNEGVMLCDFVLAALPEFLRKMIARKSLTRAEAPMKKLMQELVNMITEHKESLDQAEIRDFIDQYLAKKEGIDYEVIASTVLVFMPDSIETVAIAIYWLLFYVTKHQDVLKKLQNEVDEVVGKDCSPSLVDKPNLPYSEATMLETLRCSDMIAMTPAREMVEDVAFEGHVIPKGTIVIASLHSVRLDPEIFPEPTKFDPSRFIDSDGKLNQTMVSHVIPFGLGRRMCMGEMYAKSVIFLTLVRLAQKFNMRFDPGEPEPPVTTDPESGFVKKPHPHKLCLSIR